MVNNNGSHKLGDDDEISASSTFEELQMKIKESLDSFEKAARIAEKMIVSAQSSSVDNNGEKLYPPREGINAYIQLKACSRVAFKAAYLLRELQKKDQAELDELGLELQNLNYRKRRLMEEVERSRCFECVQVSKIAEAGGVTLTINDNIIHDTEHTTRLDALNLELSERMSKAQTLASARQDLQERMARLERLKDAVRDLPVRLEALRRIAEPLASTLALVDGPVPMEILPTTNHDQAPSHKHQLTVIKKRKRLDDIHTVPTPLYLLYRQLEAAADTHAVPESVTCDLETSGERPVVILSTKAAPERVVKFYYFPSPADCIIVGVFDLAATNDRSEFEASLDLSLLFAGDDGKQLPAGVSHRLLISNADSQKSTFPGRAFEWAQWLAGREARAATSSRLVLARIVDRLQAHKALDQQLQGLERRPPHLCLHAHCPSGLSQAWSHHTALPAHTRATLNSWSELPLDTDTEKEDENNDLTRTFVAEITRSKIKFKLLVKIPAAYPFVPPLFILGDPARHDLLRTFSDLQFLVNARFHNFVDLNHDQARYWLLSHQLIALLIAFDHVAKHTSSSDTTSIITGDFLGTRYRRGKDRRRPLLFDSALNVYAHEAL
uniref:Uncharacterized protein n=1 Tax=Aureoumbra lagunensis TaxID=44058 RepID=A0A7S3NRH2_9STRA|mmetsp:Transcript_19319/g.29333  ORF Transcript_19319/g.29333 Transcript_19319/m.29333 type:complete len:611 (+) Transcript_19319:35-1867(+)|eukprot:CAMPEP_0197321832 /NCGR_PEP_ID=MMETSP0891-20130614/66566_1 /TAXON_ID=44058 ORGANISM="Aureoumbra lagunensis, Strain CCMP1510" /NCGR_SAMPLE_ID=MMETSP0891 /ASSEMBLY_ACC=CAM_ASM_000534 /LENGTH=610 /DNA_ID=CAMNT_0042813903 /DNA_START=13 /DNA_END=1845 /DNA_ORIENTATION=+